MPPIIWAQADQQHLECLLCARRGSWQRQGKDSTLHQDCREEGTHLLICPTFIKCLLGGSRRALGERGEQDNCGPWSLGMHCSEEGMSKETITSQLGEAGQVFAEPPRLTRVQLSQELTEWKGWAGPQKAEGLGGASEGGAPARLAGTASIPPSQSGKAFPFFSVFQWAYP